MSARHSPSAAELGATQLKNIAEPIRVYSLEVGQPPRSKPVPPPPEKPGPPRLSLVVLPFANIGGDPQGGVFRRRRHREPYDRPFADFGRRLDFDGSFAR
jgi:adenylate cyclase